MKKVFNLLFLVVIFLQTACGGGRGVTDNIVTKIEHKTPDGIWHGTINTIDLKGIAVTYDMDVIITNTQFFAVTSSKVNSIVTQHDLYTGTVTLSNNALSGSVTVFKNNVMTNTFSITGSVFEQSVFSGLSGSINSTDNFSLRYDSNYDRDVNLTTLSGNWKTQQETQTPQLTITGDQIQGNITANCFFQGVLLQPKSANNAFITSNATLTGVNCIAANNYNSIITIEETGDLTFILTDVTNDVFIFFISFLKQP